MTIDRVRNLRQSTKLSHKTSCVGLQISRSQIHLAVLERLEGLVYDNVESLVLDPTHVRFAAGDLAAYNSNYVNHICKRKVFHLSGF